MKRFRELTVLAVVLLAILASPAARAELRKSLITGVCTDGSYDGGLNQLYQWDIGRQTNGSDSRMLGKLDLDTVSPFSTMTNFLAMDVAMMSDQRVALTYTCDEGGTRYRIAVLTVTPVAGHGITVTVDATLDQVLNHGSLGPLPEERVRDALREPGCHVPVRLAQRVDQRDRRASIPGPPIHRRPD